MKSSTCLAFFLMFVVVHVAYPLTASQERRDRLLKMMAQQAVSQVKARAEQAGSREELEQDEEYLQKVAKAQTLLKHVQARDKQNPDAGLSQEAQRLATVMQQVAPSRAATQQESEEELVNEQQEINVQQQQEVAASATEEFKKLMEKIKAHNIQFTREEYLLNERKALQLVEQMFPKLSGVNQEAIASINNLINTINTEYTKAIQKQATNTAGWIWSVNTKEYLDNFYKGVDKIARQVLEQAQKQQEEQGQREQGQEVQQQSGAEQGGVNAYDAFKKAIQEIRNHKKRYTPQERKASEDKAVKGAEFALKTILPIKHAQAVEVFKNQYKQTVQFQADAVTPKPKKGKKPAANVSKEVATFNNRINGIVQKLNQQQQERDIQPEEPYFEQQKAGVPMPLEQQEFILPPGLQLPAIPPVPGQQQIPVQPSVQPNVLNLPPIPGNVPVEMPQAPVVPVVKVEPEKDPQQEFDKYIEFIVKKAKEHRIYGDEEEGDDETLFEFAEKIMRKQTDSSALKNAYDNIINKYNTGIKASYRTDFNRESGLGEDTRLTDFDKRVSQVYEPLQKEMIKKEDASAVGLHKQFLDFINALAEKRLLDETELKQHEDEAVALATQWLAQVPAQDKAKVVETIKERYKIALRAEAQNSTDWFTWARDTTQEEKSFNQRIDEAVAGRKPEPEIPAQGAGVVAE